MSSQFLLRPCFIEIPVFNANSVSAASDLGLHCLPMSLLWNARLKLVNTLKRNSIFQDIRMTSMVRRIMKIKTAHDVRGDFLWLSHCT